MSAVIDLVNWTIAILEPYGSAGLFLLAFIESSFFPVPPDVLLIGLSLLKPEHAIFYGFVATIGSVSGGVFGYWIGFKLGEPILEHFTSKKRIETVHDYFDRYEAWAVGIAGLTPIPYKVFTIAAGIFYVNLRRFILASLIGRGLRFMTVGIVLFLYGESIVEFIELYFGWITIGIALIAILLAFVYYRLRDNDA
ncbi:DedA family protein [Methanosarcinales archaeon]|uniref:Lipoprotein B n=1 Tax=Candidatus Syntropharchaeum caldarium TaxID=1838285 RepID=A0A1F2PA59_9EURY|nr:MAG: lipoprotein B [Candidatus Syntrophoarchaeum caldarius]RLG34990.1 MAG: DedA family protein [Methanosarcinales archaeon]